MILENYFSNPTAQWQILLLDLEKEKSLFLAPSVYHEHLAWRNWRLAIHKLQEEKTFILVHVQSPNVNNGCCSLADYGCKSKRKTIIFFLIIGLEVAFFSQGGRHWPSWNHWMQFQWLPTRPCVKAEQHLRSLGRVKRPLSQWRPCLTSVPATPVQPDLCL